MYHPSKTNKTCGTERTTSNWRTSLGRHARTYLQLYADTRYILEDRPERWMIGTDGESLSKKIVLETRLDSEELRIKRIWHWITLNCWYAIQFNQANHYYIICIAFFTSGISWRFSLKSEKNKSSQVTQNLLTFWSGLGDPFVLYIYIYMFPYGGWALWRRNCRPPLA